MVAHENIYQQKVHTVRALCTAKLTAHDSPIPSFLSSDSCATASESSLHGAYAS